MKILRRGLLLFIALFMGMIIVNKSRFFYGWEDAFFRTLLAPFEETVWATNFSVESFEMARLTMGGEEISRLLGEPLRKDCGDNGECIWIYSWQATGTDDFDQRWVVFNSEGKVSELRKSFFID